MRLGDAATYARVANSHAKLDDQALLIAAEQVRSTDVGDDSFGLGLHLARVAATTDGGFVVETAMVAQNFGAQLGRIGWHEGTLLLSGLADPSFGWPDGSTGEKLFHLPLQWILDAERDGEYIDVFESARQADFTPDFELADDGTLLLREIDADGKVSFERLEWTPDSDGFLQPSGRFDLLKALPVQAIRGVAGSPWLVVKHQGGFLVLDPR